MTATEYAISTARLAALAAQDRHGESIVAFDVSENLAITDIFLVVSASNERTVGAIVDAVERKLRDEANLKPVRREGDRQNRWVLLDYLDVVVHVQHSEERELYSLERLWRDSPTIDLDLPEQGGAAVSASDANSASGSDANSASGSDANSASESDANSASESDVDEDLAPDEDDEDLDEDEGLDEVDEDEVAR